MESKHVTYDSYLKIPELLQLQQRLSQPAEHDEMLFIVIHQVYELWFKLLLHELEKVRSDLHSVQLYEAVATIKRVRMVLKTLVSQLDVLETMTPMSFASFRGRLESASGFQSVQFRAVEFLLGYKRPDMMKHYASDQPGFALLQRYLSEPSLVDALYAFLAGRGVAVPPELLNRADLSKPTEPSEALQTQLVAVYKTQPDAVILLELLTDIDEGIQEWRYRHVKMVERTIGIRMGTGGSSGAEFLRATLFKPLFPDLWAIRSSL